MMIHLNTLIANRNSIILLKIKVCFHISVVEIVKRCFSLCYEYLCVFGLIKPYCHFYIFVLEATFTFFAYFFYFFQLTAHIMS